MNTHTIICIEKEIKLKIRIFIQDVFMSVK
jgi:hypothetical protein